MTQQARNLLRQVRVARGSADRVYGQQGDGGSNGRGCRRTGDETAVEQARWYQEFGNLTHSGEWLYLPARVRP